MNHCDQKELLNEMRNDIKKILQRVSKLEVKAGIFGLIGGMIPFILWFLKTKG